MATQENDEDDMEINPAKMLFPADETHGNGPLPMAMLTQDTLTSSSSETEQHYMPSIESTLVIRQLPSQGLSFKLWPAATTLVTLLDQFCSHPSNSPLASSLSNGCQLNILELGSGTGLVGMAAAAILGAKVTVTDLPHVLTNLQFNVDANAGLISLRGGSVHVASLRWGEAEANDVAVVGREFDVILASDVVYHDHLFDPLLATLRLFLNSDEPEPKKKKMNFVMAHFRRWKKDSVFFKKAKKLFDVETIHADLPCNGARLGVVVYRMTGKAKSSKSSSQCS
ncbi:hypothetical protein AB3S75_002148 [Citrus x aurantiifolia]